MNMNELQKKILDVIQSRFPIEARPFAWLAVRFCSDEAAIISQITQLKQIGIIRPGSLNCEPSSLKV